MTTRSLQTWSANVCLNSTEFKSSQVINLLLKTIFALPDRPKARGGAKLAPSELRIGATKMKLGCLVI